MYNKLVNYFVVAVTLLTSISFLQLSIIDSSIIKALEIFTIGLLIIMNVLYVVYGPKKRIGGRFTPYIYLLLLSSVPCIFAAYAWHQQGFLITIWTQRLLLLYIFYFTLKHFNIDYKVLEKTIYILGIFMAIAYVLQYSLYPIKLFNVGIIVDRGTIRIEMPGLVYHEIAFLYSFSKLLKRFDIKHLIVFLFLLSVFVLYGSRGLIITSSVSMILLIILSKKTSSKYVVGFLIFGIASLVLFQFKDIFKQVLITSTRDIASGSSYIRIRAAKYFLGDFYPNSLAYIIGNGDYNDNSPYGMQMASLVRNFRFYLTDLGVLIPYVKYGIFFIIVIIMILIKAIRMKFLENQLYIKAFIINLIIYFPLGGSYDKPGFIISFVMLLYINEKANETYFMDTRKSSSMEKS